MKKWLILGLLLCLPVVGWAQATVEIQWQHDGLNVTTFKCVVDSSQVDPGTVTDLGNITPVDGWYKAPLSQCTGVMVNGQHSVVIQACNAGGCTDATAITVVKL